LNTQEISNKIKRAIGEWTFDIQSLSSHPEIIAVIFGAQRVFDGFELYLSGHSCYDESDLWYLDNQWKPRENYISLGQDSLRFDRLEILEIYEKEIQDEITRAGSVYGKLIIVVGLSDGDLKRLT
jgi:hypothetical protein